MKPEREELSVWVDHKNRIISFHFEKGYAKELFSTREEMMRYVIAMLDRYKVQ